VDWGRLGWIRGIQASAVAWSTRPRSESHGVRTYHRGRLRTYRRAQAANAAAGNAGTAEGAWHMWQPHLLAQSH
jgi:hypothetical protein